MGEKLYGGLALSEISECFEGSLVKALAQDLLTARKEVGMFESRIRGLEATLASKPPTSEPLVDLVALLYCRKKAESLLRPQIDSRVVDAGTVTRIDQKLGLVGVRLNSDLREIAVSLFADNYISEESKTPTVGDCIQVFINDGRVEAFSVL